MICASLIQLDQQATLWLNSLHSPFSDQIWMLFSNVRIWFPLYAVIVFFLFRNLGWKRALVVLVSLILTVVLTDQIANLVKSSVMRLRPCHTPEMLEQGLWCPLAKGGKYGFFSAHAANTFAFAMASTLGFASKKGGVSVYYIIGIFVWAALVSLSRVFMAMHYLGDILAGMLFGLAVGTLMGLLARWIIGRLKIETGTSKELTEQ